MKTIVVIGTGTEVGKTYVTCALVAALRSLGITSAARKPAQSYDPDDTSERDADLLAAATGETAQTVCPRHRWYPVAMAPPIAAQHLAAAPWTIQDLVTEIAPASCDVKFIEGAGGLRSPLSADGDNRSLIHALQPDGVLLVADAGLGTINAVRLTLDALSTAWPGRAVVMLNRFDVSNPVHETNAAWLATVDEITVARTIDELATLLLTP